MGQSLSLDPRKPCLSGGHTLIISWSAEHARLPTLHRNRGLRERASRWRRGSIILRYEPARNTECPASLKRAWGALHNFPVEWAGLYGPPGWEHEDGIRTCWRRDWRDLYPGISSTEAPKRAGCRLPADDRAAGADHCVGTIKANPLPMFLSTKSQGVRRLSLTLGVLAAGYRFFHPEPAERYFDDWL